MRRLTLAGIITTAALALGGCAGRARVVATTPSVDYVAIGDGAYIVPGYDNVYYADDYYWRYNNNRWYRSSYVDRGWSYARPPQVIARIDSPGRYHRNYRSTGRVHHAPRTVSRPVVRRDYRDDRYDRGDRYDRRDRYDRDRRDRDRRWRR